MVIYDQKLGDMRGPSIEDLGCFSERRNISSSRAAGDCTDLTGFFLMVIAQFYAMARILTILAAKHNQLWSLMGS